MKGESILSFTDENGKKYTFSKSNYDIHKLRHPELNNHDYLKEIKNRVLNCDVENIYPAYKKKNRYVYYEYLGKVSNIEWYNQVVVQKTKYEYIIVTAYRFRGIIREKKYGGHVCQKP